MKRFINAKRYEYHNATITEFSDTSRLMTSGVARGFSSTKYAWLADFLFKQRNNVSLNPNTGYVSFFSDREIFHQEYGNIARLYNRYPFLSSYARQVLSPHSYEMTSKQYSKVGQRVSEFDSVEYINASYLERGVRAEYANPSYEPPENYDTIPSSFDVKHGFYRAPCYHAVGYKVDMEHSTPGWKYFDEYFWTKHWLTDPYIFEDYLRMEITPTFLGDMLGSDGLDTLEAYPESEWDKTSLIKRLVDYKLQVDNARYIFFDESLNEWVTYFNDTNRYLGQTYYPYVGLAAFYNKNWHEVHPFSGFPAYDEYIAFFPEVMQRGVLEPSKIIVNWGKYTGGGSPDSPRPGPTHGRLTFNPVNHLGEQDDQSRLIYNVCRYMITLNTAGDRFEVQRNDPDDTMLVYAGIDIDTERNRRYSSVVMTEPYFVANPILNGVLIDYMFVDWTGQPVSFANESEFTSQPAMYLRIKAPMSVISEIDRLLTLEEYNDDVIDVFEIKDPRSHSAEIAPTYSDYYEDLASTDAKFFRRQDDCLDDLIDNIVGGGKHKEFWITPTGPNASKYSGNGMKVCGIGFVCKTTVDGFGVIQPIHDEFIRLYCTNYAAVSCYAKDDSSFTPIANETIETVTDTDIFTSRESADRFRPMLKLSGVNGYVKILARNTHYKVSRAPDGQYEVTYNVEFPYCPGSYFTRAGMAFTGYETTQIYYKGSYIEAGSHAAEDVGGEDRYDIANDRHAPYGDDSFNRHEILTPLQKSGYVTTNPYRSGGGIENLTLSERDLIRYPANLVWQVSDWNLLSLVKPQLDSFRRYGTYRISLWEEPEDIVDAEFNIVDDGNTGWWISGNASAANWLNKWVSVQMFIDPSGGNFGSNLGSPIIYTSASSSDAPDQDIAAVRITLPGDGYDIYIESIEIKEDDVIVDSTDFSSGWNGWSQIVGTGISIVDSPDASGKSLLRTGGTGTGQVIEKVLATSLDITKPIRVTYRVWFPTDGDFGIPAWAAANVIRMDVMPYNGRGYYGEIYPDNNPFGVDHYIQGATVTTEGASIFSRDMKLFSFTDNRNWRFGNNSFGSYIGREVPSYICDVDISTLLEDYTAYQDRHGSIPEMKRWLYGYFSGFAHTSQIPARDFQSTEIASTQVSTLPREGVRPLATAESESDIIIEIWDSESDIGNGEVGNWRPFMPTRYDTLKVPGNLIIDGIHRHDIAPIHVVDDLYKIYLSYYLVSEDTEGFEFPAGTNLDGLENVVLYDKIDNKWYHVAYIEETADVPTKPNSYAAIVRTTTPEGIHGYDTVPTTGEEIIPDELTPIELWPLRLQYPRVQISKNPLSDFYTEKVVEGSADLVVGRYVDISDLVDAVRSGATATNRYVDENNKVKFRIRVSRLKKAFDPTLPLDAAAITVNTTNETEDESKIQYIGAQSKSGSEWFNFPWTPDDGTTFDPGFDFAKVYAAELARRFGMTYFKCTSR